MLSSGKKTTVQEFGTLGVLYSSEEAGRSPHLASEDLQDIFRRENWAVGQNSDLERLFQRGQLVKQSRLDVLDANSISKLSTSAHETDAMISILKPLLSVALDHQNRHRQLLDPITSKLSKGVSSLPDQLLAMIFKFAVQSGGHKGGAQAKFLSHVSRRFRKVALSEPRLWTTLCSFASNEELETFISRAGALPHFTVFFHLQGFHSRRAVERWNSFVDVCQPTLSRWRSLTFAHFSIAAPNCDTKASSDFPLPLYYPSGDPVNSDITNALSSLRNGDEAHLPSLRELNIECTQKQVCSQPGALPWKSPNLQSLPCGRYLPCISSAKFASVTTLSLSPYFTADHVSHSEKLLSFLVSLPSLISLDLTLNNTDTIKHKRPPRLPNSICLSLKVLHLQLPSFRMLPERQNSTFIGAFLNALQMPNLEDLAISIRFRQRASEDVKEEEGADCINELVPYLVVALLPNQFSEPFTCLSSLKFNIAYEPGSTNETSDNKPDNLPKSFSIPLNRIPSVTTLTITSITQISFTIEDHATTMTKTKSRQKRKKNCTGKKLPLAFPKHSRLRELRFSGCGDIMKDGGFQSAVQSLEEAGIWGALERVVVEDCRSMGYEDALTVVGGERLHFRN